MGKDSLTLKCFMPHQDDRFRFPSSRDWEDQVVCKASKCVANDKHGHCIAPSLAKIGEEGVCENFTLKK